MTSIAIFGGTFDPVHQGHMQTSLTIQNEFQFDYYHFLPCKIPTLKPAPLASNKQRIEMLQLAIKECAPKARNPFVLDLREIFRHSASYMVDTLTSYREEYPEASLTLILGYDSFLSLPKWHQWEQLIKLANLLVISRQVYAKEIIPAAASELLTNHRGLKKEELLTNKSGIIFLFDAGDYPISSQEIRSRLGDSNDLQKKLPSTVYDYIKQTGLYQ